MLFIFTQVAKKGSKGVFKKKKKKEHAEDQDGTAWSL